jgi:ABC-type lipopolysaccharide export system ATPase subunit
MDTVAAERPVQQGEAATPLLELRDINKQYGLNRVLNNVSFHVRRAEILALLGDNGAGKSTLVKTMSGVVQPDSGTLLWEGKPVVLNSHADAAELGIETIYQDSSQHIYGARDGWSARLYASQADARNRRARPENNCGNRGH